MLRHLLLVAWNALQRRQGLGVARVLVVAVTIGTLNLFAGLVMLLLGDHPWLRAGPQPLLIGSAIQARDDGTLQRTGFAARELERLLAGLPGVARAALYAHDPGRVRVGRGAAAQWLEVRDIDGEVFAMASLQFVAGRALDPRPDAPAELVVTEWAARMIFGATDVLGRHLTWSRGTGTVVGVVRDVEPSNPTPLDVKIWANRQRRGGVPQSAHLPRGYGAILQLAPGASATPVELAFAQRLAGTGSKVTAAPRTLLGDFAAWFAYRTGLPAFALALLAAAATMAMLALPAISLANVTMASLLERQAEIGVRRAFGASAGQIVVQVLAEALLVVALGGALALLGPLSLDAILDDESMYMPGFTLLDWTSFGVCLCLILALTAISGLLPALRIARAQPLQALRGQLR